jgi:Uma2 family endonuclease
MAETGIHVLLMLTLIATLRQHFRARSDVYVIGNIFLYYEEGHSESRRSPDVMVVKGVPSRPERRSFKTWEEGAVPCFVLELTSRETAEEDQHAKRDLYERLGVTEYFLFDPLHEYLDSPLVGHRLIGGRYERLIAGADGGLLSSQLGLRLVPEGEDLALFDFRTGKRVLTPPAVYAEVEQALRLAAEAEQRAEQERQRAAHEQQRADQAEQRTELEQQRAEEAERRAEQERQRAEQEQQRAEQERQRAEQERQRAEREQQHAEQERQRAAEAEQRAEQQRQRAEQLAAELARLRAALPPDVPPPPAG